MNGGEPTVEERLEQLAQGMARHLRRKNGSATVEKLIADVLLWPSGHAREHVEAALTVAYTFGYLEVYTMPDGSPFVGVGPLGMRLRMTWGAWTARDG